MNHDSRDAFDPELHAERLIRIVEAVGQLETLAIRDLSKILSRNPKPRGGCYSKTQLIMGVRHLAARQGWDERAMLAKLRVKPMRTQSGVAPVTVLTHPHPCPGQCVFCPNDVTVPKSYLPGEPSVQRARENRFDPYAQAISRLRGFHVNGHEVDKVEFIVQGGTWTSYPPTYRLWFIKRCFDAMNDFGHRQWGPCAADSRLIDFEPGADGQDLGALAPAIAPASASASTSAAATAHELAPATELIGAYNRSVQAHVAAHGGPELPPWNEASWSELEAAQLENETARCRCVGLAIGTRPDGIDADEIVTLRRLGVTKVQLGAQSFDDAILAANRRGHRVADTRRAFALLRAAGFKIHAHWMPNLLGADPEGDLADFARMFEGPDFRPDELKIYPCSLVAGTELFEHYQQGRWHPYSEATLVELLTECLAQVPAYCRVTRLMRDIPAHYILDGTTTSNLRQTIEAELQRRGRPNLDMRARQVRGEALTREAISLKRLRYPVAGGTEQFYQMVTEDDRLAAFLRLFLPEAPSPIAELGSEAIIRELHTYGGVAPIGPSGRANAQHHGLGRELVEAACVDARAAGFDRMAVISAVGTRRYYESCQFAPVGPDGLYQHRALGRGPR